MEVVVARYTEDVEWLSPIAPLVTMYNKGPEDIPDHIASQFKEIVCLPNVGRESHTYLYHILNRYDSLAPTTVFIQGRIQDHLPASQPIAPHDFVTALGNEATLYGVSKNAHPYTEYGVLSAIPSFSLQAYYANGVTPASRPSFGEWMETVVQVPMKPNEAIPWFRNALFAVRKERITRYPKTYYEKLLREVDGIVNPEAAHYFERAWHAIFTAPSSKAKTPLL